MRRIEHHRQPLPLRREDFEEGDLGGIVRCGHRAGFYSERLAKGDVANIGRRWQPPESACRRRIHAIFTTMAAKSRLGTPASGHGRVR